MNDEHWKICWRCWTGGYSAPFRAVLSSTRRGCPAGTEWRSPNTSRAKRSGSTQTASLIETFPDIWFLPGFWSEFGMCTEPSAFGARCIFPKDEFPFAEKILSGIEQIDYVKKPDPTSDGLLPLVLSRLKWARPRIEDLGHRIRFSVSRGPLNIASFLMGATEFLTALKTDPGQAHRLLRVVTRFPKRVARPPEIDVSKHRRRARARRHCRVCQARKTSWSSRCPTSAKSTRPMQRSSSFTTTPPVPARYGTTRRSALTSSTLEYRPRSQI